MTLRPRLLDTIAVLAGALLAPAAATAQSATPEPGAWQYSATLYGYLPSISGNTAFPADSGGVPINISAQQIIDSLKMTFMGTLEANNGRWGAFTDIVYVNLGHTKTGSRDFTIGDIGLPVGTTSDLGLDFKATVWTLAGEYRVASDPGLTVDAIAGTRMLDLKQRLNWTITGSIGPLDPVNRTGKAEADQTVWDGIVGVRGRYAFGAQREWSVPFYLDLGAGQSTMTWQAATGIGYGFKWGELSALYRWLDYDMKSGKAIQGVRMSGPQVGATFRW